MFPSFLVLPDLLLHLGDDGMFDEVRDRHRAATAGFPQVAGRLTYRGGVEEPQVRNSGAQAGFATLPATIGNTWRAAPPPVAQQSTSYSMSPSYARSGMSYSTSYQQVEPDHVLIQRALFTVNRMTKFDN